LSDNQLIHTIEFATASSASRGAISVIDRLQFGIRRKRITATNIHNNIAALLFAFFAAGLLGKLSGIGEQITDLRVIVFAILLQVSAHSFSYAFRYMKVPSIIIVTKVADIFIAPLIFLLFNHWSFPDFLFASITSTGCLAILFSGNRQHLHLKSSLLVCVFLIAQGALSPWYMSQVIANHNLWLPFTSAVLVWRLLFSLVFSFRELPQVHRSFFGHEYEYWTLHVFRAILTLSAQAFLVLALSMDRPVIAWPILNATGLFSILFSTYLLKEGATRQESFAILFVAVVGAARIAM
jgi:hypothetical protein